MRVLVTSPYPLVLAKEGDKKLVLFLEKPFKRFFVEEPWKLLSLRGACVLEGRRLLRQVVIEKEVTLAVTSFDPRPIEADPEEVLEQLLGEEGPCERLEAWGVEALKCGHLLLAFGKKDFPPLGFGVIKSRVDVIGVRMRLEV